MEFTSKAVPLPTMPLSHHLLIEYLSLRYNKNSASVCLYLSVCLFRSKYSSHKHNRYSETQPKAEPEEFSAILTIVDETLNIKKKGISNDMA